ncbi:hypothetical protein MVEN_02345300 [Mycena venus]|uniref:Uncharacterized protein n=1 Tax=Mycena venus TaxID=2733690 RepID=A0A8H7CFB8_9AGAR|nr:hypothetical protein MVEN_02345300 [Mycena venus]
MPSSARLLALAALVISSARAIVPPGQQGAFNQSITQLSGGPDDRRYTDLAIEGSTYLPYTLVPNSTYNIDACLAWAATIDGCVADIVTVNLVFVNLYYEFNNYLLDFVFSEESNLKCAAYADIHTAAEKTNFGGQASYPQAGSYMFSSVARSHAQCSIWASPSSISMMWTRARNFAMAAESTLSVVDAPTSTSWRALVDGIPTTTILLLSESTADNTGQGDLVVTFSRGYKPTSASPHRMRPGSAPLPAAAIRTRRSFFPTYAYTGNSVGLLGAAFGDDFCWARSLPLRHPRPRPASHLEASANVDITWNGATVGTFSGFSDWQFCRQPSPGTGSDQLAFVGSPAPAGAFIDNCLVHQA